ncbi:MAG: hypothetical protein IPH08_07780 [Rhodocyclaceae bacterium]|nr:hypothetical protein [Rhodocyclaceae bacterium]
MATLTPLAKGLIGLAVIGGMASAVWNLGLKDYMAAATVAAPVPATPPSTPATGTQAAVAVPVPPTAVSPAPTSGSAVAVEPVLAPTEGKAITAAESGEKGRQLLDAGNYAHARIFLEQAVKMGDGPAACRLGEMTLKGQGGLIADRDKSASLFQLAQSRGMICFASGQ